MAHPVFFDSHIIAEIPEDITGMRILDVGCGHGAVGMLIASYRYQSFNKPPLIIGMDIDLESLKFLREYSGRIYSEVLRADARYLPFRSNSFDITAAIEMIEHVSKDESYTIIKELERVTYGKIIITTPNGFMPGYGHACGWTAKELRKIGFKVYGIGSKLRLRIHNKKIYFLLYLLFTPISYFLPIFSQALIATKLKRYIKV